MRAKKMAEQSWNSWFDTQLDLVANGLPFEFPSPKQANGTTATTLVADLQMNKNIILFRKSLSKVI